MQLILGRIIVLVDDYDDALTYYTETLGFETLVDLQSPDGQRFVHVQAPGQSGIGIWFLLADTPEKEDRVGNQPGGEPLAVLYTADCRRAYAELTARGVAFRVPPETEGGDIYAHFHDLYGNEFVLVQLREK